MLIVLVAMHMAHQLSSNAGVFAFHGEAAQQQGDAATYSNWLLLAATTCGCASPASPGWTSFRRRICWKRSLMPLMTSWLHMCSR